MMAPNKEKIVLYHYSFSPVARRVVWYLTFRGIPYNEVRQPPVMPRPDLEAIGVNYRRIPLMAIGKDVYCDSRLILQKLEKMYPDGALGASDPDQKALQKLLEIWTMDGGGFNRSTQLIPSNMPLFDDPKFSKDREQFGGRSWSKEQVDKNRPEALAHVRKFFELLETTLLADGRDWVFKTEKPTLGDIEAIWIFDWLNGLKGALPEELISSKTYPSVFAYIKRFNSALKAAKAQAPKPTVLKGKDAAEGILGSQYAESDNTVDSFDPLGLQSGTEVVVNPIDSGFSHKDRGSLVALNKDEVVISLKNGIRLHCPRNGFRIVQAPASQAKL